MHRLASEAAVPSLEAADVESDAFDPYDARGGRAARRLPTPARHMYRTARRPAPARVSLLSRSLPEGRTSALASAFADPEQQVNILRVGCALREAVAISSSPAMHMCVCRRMMGVGCMQMLCCCLKI